MHLIALLGFAVLVAMAITTAMNLVINRSRQCPSCHDPLAEVAPSTTTHTYEVLECTACGVVVALAGGQRDRFAWCPRCKQRALDVSALRLADGRIEVHEACTLCDHHAIRAVERPRPPDHRGLVIPFRRPE